MALAVNAKAIVACTLSGMTARMISRFRLPIDILGLTTDEKIVITGGVTSGESGNTSMIKIEKL